MTPDDHIIEECIRTVTEVVGRPVNGGERDAACALGWDIHCPATLTAL